MGKKKKKVLHKSRFNVFDDKPLQKEKEPTEKPEDKVEEQPAKPAHSGFIMGGAADSGYQYNWISANDIKNRKFSWNPNMDFYSSSRFNRYAVFSEASSKSILRQKEITKTIDNIIKEFDNKIKNYGK